MPLILQLVTEVTYGGESDYAIYYENRTRAMLWLLEIVSSAIHRSIFNASSNIRAR